MAASLKQRHKQPLQGMNQIKTKISVLQQRYEDLRKQRHQDITHLLTTLELSTLDDQTLVGGLLYIKDKIASQDPLTEVWRHAGARFLRPSKSRKQRTFNPDKTPSAKAQSSQMQA